MSNNLYTILPKILSYNILVNFNHIQQALLFQQKRIAYASLLNIFYNAT